MKIRKAIEEDVNGIANVHINSWKTTYKGILPEQYLSSMNLEAKKKNWLRNLKMLHNATFVAESANGEIIGFAAGGPEQTNDPRIQGEVYAIYFLKEYQRQGLGRKMIKAVIHELIEMGHKNLIIWALKDNPSCDFYNTLGGQVIAEKTVKMAGIELIEVGFGWEDIQDILLHL
ncbi:MULTISPECIES: GNAT family N-acetyltransferase [Bacillaceae]|jgi:ribosomal protein S18 acetylase RimI-like enzyme|uniref:GNAT family N-acetyltransferase n=1 Tax=Bacillaceae TaxID=186817 RepID=UPI000BF73DE3|nr:MULTISPECIES: GNAT family N-acetyltransferase [Bacillaceae]PEZ84036.1 GNAT family N-acetyltransferase [Bacillus sp. AFS017274]